MKKGFTAMGSSGIDLSVYGDGSLNGTFRGYGRLLLNGVAPTGTDTYTDNGNSLHGATLYAAALAAGIGSRIKNDEQDGRTQLVNGVNTITSANSMTYDIEPLRWVSWDFRGGGLSPSRGLTLIKLISGGIYYTLEEAVANSIIAPLVPIWGLNWPTTLTNIYEGGYSASTYYHSFGFLFLTLETVTGYQLTLSGGAVTYSGDGINIYSWNYEDGDITI